MKTLIIAEAGVNHNGDINLAKQLIDVAADAGADLVKFQTFNAERIVTKSADKAKYQINTTDRSESQYAMLEKLELTEEMHRDLITYCNTVGIEFFSTGFDIESVNLLNKLGQEFFKVPSGEITNHPYLQHVGQLGKKIILSTGMSDMHEIEAAIMVLELAGTPRSKLTLLHCTTAYPTPMSDVNLLAMRSIQKKFGVAVGYSDHTLGIEVPISAVALGASIIEKHFTINRKLPGPDHKASLEPFEFKSMVSAIRNIEIALGNGLKQVMPSEITNQGIIRKSIVAKSHIGKDEILSADNLTTKRPGTGISPIYWNSVIGKKANREYMKDELIEE